MNSAEHVLTFLYAGLRGLGPAHFTGAQGQSIGHPTFMAPAHLMSDVVTTNGQLTSILASHQIERFVPLVRCQVTEERFAHIVRVTGLALAIAEANSFSELEREQVAQSAILHDAARDLSDAQLVRLAPPEIELERRHPLALHGRAGRALAAAWGVTDQAVLGAVEGHVFGVSVSDKVGTALYIADVSEEGRGVNQRIRELAMNDLPAAYRLAVHSKVDYLRQTGKDIHPDTLATYNSLAGNRADAHPGTPLGSLSVRMAESAEAYA